MNASADRYIDLQEDGEALTIVAMDGMPLAYHDPAHPTRFVPPAARIEAIVTGPAPSAKTALRSLCVDRGREGDPNRGMVLADIVPGVTLPHYCRNPLTRSAHRITKSSIFKLLSNPSLSSSLPSPKTRTAFTSTSTIQTGF